ncbi:acyl-CoA dehydrogenase family protein [Streptomyces daliensis]|uniref:Acyl-CoA dehydrogenase family protein n=1 Tax=Streptomyces daliensis TaxID=299421 RepID=A0A8T4ITF7_9ACTN|nr:acyl-CoA dehydrogenase family protein [Streptomyces daliensis]
MGEHYLTQEHRALRATVRDFAEREVGPRVREMESARTVAVELTRLIADQRLIGATIPRAYGGMGTGHLAKTVIIEELSRVSAAMGAMVQASQLGTAPLCLFGSTEQKKTWLPAIASGDCLPTIAVTEPDSGGHVLGMTSTADRDDDEWVLNGGKTYVGNSHVGNLHTVVARTGPGSQGLSAFLVEADRPGCSLIEQQPTMGLHGFSFGELRFENCRIPAAHMLGTEGDGLAVAYASSVLYGRPNLAAVALGIHQATVETTAAFCAQRHRYGAPLADLGSVKLQLGQMTSRLMTAQLTAYHAVHLLDGGQPCDEWLINSKLVNTEYARASAHDAMNIHGAAALGTDLPIERYRRDAEHIFAPAGTSDIQRLRLAEATLGTTKGSWSDKLADRVRPETAPANARPQPRS